MTTTRWIKVADLRDGDAFDLEPFARELYGDDLYDEANEHSWRWTEFELAVVDGTEVETPTCVRVDFEGGAWGFPPNVEVEVFA